MTVRLRSRKNKGGRKETYRFGIFAERTAEIYFFLRGYRAVARRWKNPVGEIDLVVAGRRRIVFVEVKARRKDNAPFALHPEQVARLHRAAQLFLAKYPRFASHEMRIDVLFVAPWRWPKHIRQAF